MRRLALLCLVTAVSGYNLVVQELILTGGRITSNEINCDNMEFLHIGGSANSYNFECHDVMSPDDKTKLESRKLVYKDRPITTKSKSLYCEILLKDQSKVTFNFNPQMKVGQWKTQDVGTPQYNPITTVAPPATTSVPPAPDCTLEENLDAKGCEGFCDDPAKNQDTPACLLKKKNGAKMAASARVKAVKKFVAKPQPEEPAVSVESTVPAAIRFRGPGPAQPPVHISPVLVVDTVVADDDEERRVKREEPPTDPPAPQVDSTTLSVSVMYYILDEAGNPAAVWAAVIEGIILILLVGACFYFFFWAPRARQVAAAAADPYKEDGPSYSVSYANSSYNNQRIDAFQAPTPAAPPRPANAGYMDDYITDNIGAMSRPAATTTQPASAVTNSSAFQPTHQRFDSSGLVTVNLS